MNLGNTAEPEFQALGGEPLQGSGFENEMPLSAFEAFEETAEEGLEK